MKDILVPVACLIASLGFLCILGLVDGYVRYRAHGRSDYLSKEDVTARLAKHGWTLRDGSGHPVAVERGMWEDDYNKMITEVDACRDSYGKKAVLAAYLL